MPPQRTRSRNDRFYFIGPLQIGHIFAISSSQTEIGILRVWSGFVEQQLKNIFQRIITA